MSSGTMDSGLVRCRHSNAVRSFCSLRGMISRRQRASARGCDDSAHPNKTARLQAVERAPRRRDEYEWEGAGLGMWHGPSNVAENWKEVCCAWPSPDTCSAYSNVRCRSGFFESGADMTADTYSLVRPGVVPTSPGNSRSRVWNMSSRRGCHEGVRWGGGGGEGWQGIESTALACPWRHIEVAVHQKL
jgi:hypothetical protein